MPKGARPPKYRGWIASLSDGTTVFEENPSSWDQLAERCKGGEYSIIILRLQYSGTTIIASKDEADGFIQYSGHRENPKTGKRIPIRAVGTIKDNFLFLNIIDQSRNIWQEIHPMSSEWEKKAIYLQENNNDRAVN